MSKQDLMNAFNIGSNPLIDELKVQIKECSTINIYLLNGELIKLGAGSLELLKLSAITNITDSFLTIQYDSHRTDILYTAIAKIEYF